MLMVAWLEMKKVYPTLDAHAFITQRKKTEHKKSVEA